MTNFWITRYLRQGIPGKFSGGLKTRPYDSEKFSDLTTKPSFRGMFSGNIAYCIPVEKMVVYVLSHTFIRTLRTNPRKEVNLIMYNIHCLNKISPKGTALLTDTYTTVADLNDAQGVLVRSAAMHDLDLPESLLAIARAGAGVNNIPLDKCAEAGIVVFNTPGANARSVMELALCGLLLSSRDIIGGINWV